MQENNDAPITKTCGIDGMHCTNCSASIERAFGKEEGIDVKVLLAQNEGVFTYDPAKWNEQKIARKLKSLGFSLHRESKVDWDLARLIASAVLTAPLFVFMILMMADVHYPHWVNYLQFGLCTVVEILAGVRFFLGAVRDVKQGVLGMDVLVTLGTLTAYVYSAVLLFAYSAHMLYFDTAAMLLTIILVGKYVEGKAKVKSAKALKELMALTPDLATVLRDGQTVEVPTEEVSLDEILVLATGSRVPLDGVVLSGVADLDESMLTGESMPVAKAEGDKVVAGTVVVRGNLRVRVTATTKETYLASIIDKVYQIQQEKPRLQKIADRIATVFVPAVVLLSLACFAATYWGLHKELAASISRAIAVLVISCPCSLGLATPLSIVVGTTRAGRMGVVYNDSEIFEKMHGVRAICFDKTGTLTTGAFGVVESESTTQLNDVAYTLESVSVHPIAKALCAHLSGEGATLVEGLDPQEIAGEGVEAGPFRMYKRDDVVYLARGSEEVAWWRVEDTLKEDARATIAKFEASGVAVYMLTGDSESVALSVADKLGLPKDRVFARITPEGKLEAIKALQAQGLKVAFVGDGINDSLALSSADFAVAIGSGTQVAISSADVTVGSDKLEQVYEALTLSRKVYRNIMQNFAWAFSYNLVAIPLAFAGILSPLVAGCCMAFSNITVVVNALRLFGVRLDKTNKRRIKQ
ncbi:MAG: cadmium-translocating P-type ATPase [Clostridia bacterium]|nr:cadmium-translocating P-type ATPase [Clostridia bacterium]